VFVAFDPGGNLLAVAADDGMVRLWDVANCAGEGATCGRLMQLLERHTMSVESLAFAPEDGLLLSGGQDNSLQLWDVRVCANGAEGCGRLLHTLEGPGTIDSLAFRPDGKVVASAEGWPSGDRLVLWGVVGE
jgi:WD40 repeat protein